MHVHTLSEMLGRPTLWRLTQVQFKNARHQNNSPGWTASFEHRELEGFRAIKENPAA
jgi:hypothetical protein